MLPWFAVDAFDARSIVCFYIFCVVLLEVLVKSFLMSAGKT